MKSILLSIILSICVVSVNGKTGTPVMPSVSAPLLFIENKGQVTDQHHNARKDVQFSVAAAPGLNVFISNGKLNYQFSRTSDQAVNAYDMYRMDVTLIGANRSAQVVKEQQQAYGKTYFVSPYSDAGGTQAASYKRITYKNIYPHIDWVLFMSNGHLEHEFVVRKGGKVSDIKLKYGGASALRVNDDGSLTASTPHGFVTEHAPLAWQANGTHIKSAFVLNGDVVTYSTGAFTGKLTIDPVLDWGTYFGGSGDEVGQSMCIDKLGNIFITGMTTSTAGIATTGAYHTTYAGGTNDAFLAKFNSLGVQQWCTYYGSNDAEWGQAVAVDSFGNVFIAGQTGSLTGVVSLSAHQTTFGGGYYDAFLAKFNTHGVLLWSTYYGGASSDYAYGLKTDKFGNVYMAGQTASTTNIATTGAYRTTLNGSTDAFIAKFNISGVRVWATYFGGNQYEQEQGLAIDSNENIYITGYTQSWSGLSTPGAYRTAFTGGYDQYLAKFTSAGAIKWATYYGGSGDDYGQSVACDDSGNVFFAGQTNSLAGIATAGAFDTLFGGDKDCYLGKFDSTGSLRWATYLGDSAEDAGRDIVIDTTHNVYLCGYTASIWNFATPGAYKASYGGGTFDAFLAKYNMAGARLWCTYYGGSGQDEAFAVTMDKPGNIYILGKTRSLSNIATPGAHRDTFGGGGSIGDAFLIKFREPPLSLNTILDDDVRIYPNPAHDKLIISGSIVIHAITISNMAGQTVFSGIYQANRAEVSMADLPTGTYLVLINNGTAYKVIKQ